MNRVFGIVVFLYISFLSTHGESVNKNDTAAENYTAHHPTQTEILKKSKSNSPSPSPSPDLRLLDSQTFRPRSISHLQIQLLLIDSTHPNSLNSISS